jgi:hypothetical protein
MCGWGVDFKKRIEGKEFRSQESGVRSQKTGDGAGGKDEG